MVEINHRHVVPRLLSSLFQLLSETLQYFSYMIVLCGDSVSSSACFDP